MAVVCHFFFCQFSHLSDCRVMKEEIAAAVFFFARLVKRYGCLDIEGRKRFAAALTSVLFENYKNHWHPNAPTKGQAYRYRKKNISCLLLFYSCGWISI